MTKSSDSGVETVLAALLKYQLNESLGQVEAALSRWRKGGLGPLAAHAEVVKHAARAERLAARIASKDSHRVASLLRDAYDVNLISEEGFRAWVGKSPDQVEPSPPVDDLGQPNKRAFVDELLEQGPILVHINALVDGVSVPPAFAHDSKLVLRFGYGLTPPIIDFVVDDNGIEGTLTFGGVPHRCILPWPSMYAVVAEGAQQIMVWSEDVPLGSVEQLPVSSEKEAPKTSSIRSVRRKAPHLRLVD